MTNKRIKGGARLRDVAAAAGVSNATVSAVVNGRTERYGIAPATRAKVEAIVRQLGYTPSLAALDMEAGRNSLVGLAIQVGHSGADRLILALEPVLAASGFRLLVTVLPTEPGAATARIGELARFGLAGLVVWPTDVTPLPALNCPGVIIGRSGAGLPAVAEDATEGGRRLARRVLDKGHRAIAIVGSSPAQAAVTAGFLEACAQAGAAVRSFGSVVAFMAEPVTATAVCCVTSAVLLEFHSRALAAG
ncbi:MAG: LacI family DNA-binding transcriptional regulator, partial [bacterium]